MHPILEGIVESLCAIPDCGKPRRKRGLCYMHYTRQFKHGDPNYVRPSVADRFWRDVEKTDGCWIWRGDIGNWGYGRIWVEGKGQPVHRVAYELLVGPIPPGLHIDHLCRNRACVNPAHLEPVSRRVNILRGEGLAAKNSRVTHCPRGHPYSGENLYVLPNGARTCRICNRERAKLFGRKQRATARAQAAH